MWFDFFDDGKEIAIVFTLTFVVVTSEWPLTDSEVFTLAFEEKARLVDAPAS